MEPPAVSDRFWVAYIWVCRLFGVLTAIGLWGIGAETVYRGYFLGVYLLCVAIVLTFTETLFVVSFWLSVCIRSSNDADHPCLRCWNSLQWLDNWKKGILYLLMSVGCYVSPVEVWIALISGAMLVVTSLLYFVKTVKDRQDRRPKNRAYGRFNDDVTDSASSRRIVRDVSTPLPVDQSAVDRDDVWEV